MDKRVLYGGGAALGILLLLGLTSSKKNLFEASTKHRALAFGKPRSMDKVRLIVLHSTEGDTAEGAASWFADPRSGVSTHLVVGEDGAFRAVPDDVVAYGAAGANDDGLHIELAGRANWSRDRWLQQQKTLMLAAEAITAWSAAYAIPLRLLTAAEVKAGKRGVVSHKTISEAFRASDHFDPGPNFPYDTLLSFAGAAFA